MFFVVKLSLWFHTGDEKMFYNILLAYAKSTSISSVNVLRQNNDSVESVTLPARRDRKEGPAGLFLIVMPDSIRHPVAERGQTALDSESSPE